MFASAVYDKAKDEYIIKVANTSDKLQSLQMTFAGMKKQQSFSQGKCIKLTATDMDKDNTLDNPSAIVPHESEVEVGAQSLNVEIEPNTFAVYVLKK